MYYVTHGHRFHTSICPIRYFVPQSTAFRLESLGQRLLLFLVLVGYGERESGDQERNREPVHKFVYG